MKISAEQVKTLREKTGAGIMECKQALAESSGDTNKAAEYLRKKGLVKLGKRAAREAKEGIVDSYIHAGGKIGVLIEVNCETDFVARNSEFKQFAHDIAMQIAAASPLFISRKDVPKEIVEKEKEIYKELPRSEGKPENIVERIAEGKLEKFYENICLLEQPFIKEPNKKIADLLGELASKIGEKIDIRRFTRYQLGESEK